MEYNILFGKCYLYTDVDPDEWLCELCGSGMMQLCVLMAFHSSAVIPHCTSQGFSAESYTIIIFAHFYRHRSKLCYGKLSVKLTYFSSVYLLHCSPHLQYSVHVNNY